MKLLALDTSSDACSVALLQDEVIHHRHEIAPREHADGLLGRIDDLLQQADLRLEQLDAIAYGCGPGSFTGLRIVVAAVQGLAFAANLRVIPISDLAIMAQGAWRRHGVRQVAVALDARMHEVYYGLYALDAAGLMQTQMPEGVYRPAPITMPAAGSWHGVGDGWSAHAGELPALPVLDAQARPDARDLLTLAQAAWAEGRTIPPQAALPVYLREEIAWRKTAP
jgi:tRNA threonylcarbamoyladenosine biosynthesis protein TsaB